jgi:ketosteroid isomerase-like protein
MPIPTARPDPFPALFAALFVLGATLCAGALAAPAFDAGARKREVFETERAFAQSMARRDAAAFASFLSPEAVFFAEGRATRGSEAVAADWKPLFEGARAPFSWEPAQVEVLDSGELALSTGPVRDPGGKVVATFSSIWRREATGAWRIVFDKGCSACVSPNCAK